MLKKILIILVAVLIAAGLFVVGARVFTGEDVWLCKDGQWVKHGNPSATMPIDSCAISSGFKILTTEKGNKDIIKIKNPLPNQEVPKEAFKPLLVEGQARGNWFFEGSFPVMLLDPNGFAITQALARAQGNWMTESFVSFKAELNDFTIIKNMDAVLVLQRDNPSDLPENSDQVKIPIKLLAPQTMLETLKIFFSNSQMDPEISCSKVFSVSRSILHSSQPARDALELLLSGDLTEQEKLAGFSTSIPLGVKIQKLTIENGTAKVDFNDALEYQMGGSCRVSAIRAQIEQTLKQFPTVQNVIISINGRTEDILQP